jgi:hypothetical protein
MHFGAPGHAVLAGPCANATASISILARARPLRSGTEPAHGLERQEVNDAL